MNSVLDIKDDEEDDQDEEADEWEDDDEEGEDDDEADSDSEEEQIGLVDLDTKNVDMDMEIALFNADHNQNLDETLALARKAYANRPCIHGADALAWALYKTGNYTEAETYSREALKLGTKDSLKLFHAGMIALELGDKLQAREYLEEALAINPHFSILYASTAQEMLQLLKR